MVIDSLSTLVPFSESGRSSCVISSEGAEDISGNKVSCLVCSGMNWIKIRISIGLSYINLSKNIFYNRIPLYIENLTLHE